MREILRNLKCAWHSCNDAVNAPRIGVKSGKRGCDNAKVPLFPDVAIMRGTKKKLLEGEAMNNILRCCSGCNMKPILEPGAAVLWAYKPKHQVATVLE